MEHVNVTIGPAKGEETGVFHSINELLGVVAWPLVVAFLLWWYWRPLTKLLVALSARLGDTDTDVSISKEGLSFKRHEVLEGRAEAIHYAEQQIKEGSKLLAGMGATIQSQAAATTEEATTSPDLMQKMKELIGRYDSGDRPNIKEQRVQFLNTLADQMGRSPSSRVSEFSSNKWSRRTARLRLSQARSFCQMRMKMFQPCSELLRLPHSNIRNTA